MALAYTREYELKFYLNARHYVIFDGKRGADHPHTWEFTLTIQVPGGKVIPFNAFENVVNDYFEPYQNRVLNEAPPFDAIMPTLESMVEEFGPALTPLVANAGGKLVCLKGSEGPTRSYILRVNDADGGRSDDDADGDALSNVVDAIVGEALK